MERVFRSFYLSFESKIIRVCIKWYNKSEVLVFEGYFMGKIIRTLAG